MQNIFSAILVIKNIIEEKESSGPSCPLGEPREDDSCKTLRVNGHSGHKFDVVFIGDSYETIADLETDSMIAINHILSEPVYGRNEQRINFHMSKQLVSGSYNIDCILGDCRYALMIKAKELASNCPYDKIIVLSNRNFRSIAYMGEIGLVSIPYEQNNPLDDFLESDIIGGSSTFGIFTLGSAYGQLQSGALRHEFSHLYGIADEYTKEGGSDHPHEPNCAPDKKTAQVWWGDLVGQENVRFHAGCSYTEDNVRPTRNGLMRYHWLPDAHLGQVNERHIQKFFDENYGFA